MESKKEISGDTKDKLKSNEEIIDEIISSCAGVNIEENEEEEPVAFVDDDLIDEVALKDAEMSLDENDLKLKREESLIHKESGNVEFKNGDFTAAAKKYTLALRTCPLSFNEDRAILFANRGACKMKRELNAEAIEDCSKAIELNPNYLKAFARRALLNENSDKLDEALEDYKKVLELDPGHKEARQACLRLPKQIEEKNEKLKTEMLGSLKELGNKILKPFGLSTENFQVTQDPSSGGYSINFKQNPSQS